MELPHILRRRIPHLIDCNIHIRKHHLTPLDLPTRLIHKILINHDELTQIRTRNANQVHLETHRNHRNLDLVTHIRIIIINQTLLERTGPPRMLRNQLTDGLDIIHLQTLVIPPASHIDQQTLGRLQIEIIQQRRLQGTLDRLLQTLIARTRTATHQRHPAPAHHIADILEVHIDVTGPADDFGNTAHRRRQHLVRMREGLVHQEIAIILVELLIVDDQQAVYIRLELVDTVDGLGNRLIAFILERNGNHSHRQDTPLLGHLGDDRRSTRTGAAAHAGGDEDHLRLRGQQFLRDEILGLDRSIAALGRIGTGSQAFAQLDLDRNVALLQGLLIGIANDEVATLDLLVVHVSDCIAAAATDADDFDRGYIRNPIRRGDDIVDVEIFRHNLRVLVCPYHWSSYLQSPAACSR